MSYKRYAFPVPNLELETLHTYARLVKAKFPEIDTEYVENLTERDLEMDIPYTDKRGNFLVTTNSGRMHWGWNPSKYFAGKPYEVVSLDDDGNREFLGGI